MKYGKVHIVKHFMTFDIDSWMDAIFGRYLFTLCYVGVSVIDVIGKKL